MSSLISDKKLWLIAIFLAEFIGTAFILFLGCMGGVDKSPYFIASGFTVSIAFGVSVMIGINCFGAVSGAFLSPIVAISAFINNAIDLWVNLVKYIFLIFFHNFLKIFFRCF